MGCSIHLYVEKCVFPPESGNENDGIWVSAKKRLLALYHKNGGF